MSKVRVKDQFNEYYTLTVEQEKVVEVYHEGWRREADLHNVQAVILTEIREDGTLVEDMRMYVTLEGLLVKMPKERLESVNTMDIESILTFGELLDILSGDMSPAGVRG